VYPSCQTLERMPLPEHIKRSFDLGHWLAAELNDLSLPASLRHRSSAACLSVTQDHQLAITSLIEQGLYSSAFALIRPLFESYVRGLWLAHCASDKELDAFSKGGEPPGITKLLAAIEALPSFADGRLSNIKAQSWNAMCEFTHTGSLQVQRWNTESSIEQNYPPEELIEALSFSGAIALLSGIGMATLAANELLELKLLERSHQYAKNAP
jgi:hypothetical protein